MITSSPNKRAQPRGDYYNWEVNKEPVSAANAVVTDSSADTYEHPVREPVPPYVYEELNNNNNGSRQ